MYSVCNKIAEITHWMPPLLNGCAKHKPIKWQFQWYCINLQTWQLNRKSNITLSKVYLISRVFEIFRKEFHPENKSKDLEHEVYWDPIELTGPSSRLVYITLLLLYHGSQLLQVSLFHAGYNKHALFSVLALNWLRFTSRWECHVSLALVANSHLSGNSLFGASGHPSILKEEDEKLNSLSKIRLRSFSFSFPRSKGGGDCWFRELFSIVVAVICTFQKKHEF